MIRTTDKAVRREEILTAYLDLVGRVGLSRATTRELAREMDMAVGGLWVYFESVDELRIAAFERTFEYVTQGRGDEGERFGLDGVAHFLDALLPVHDSSRRDALLAMAFLEVFALRDAVYEVQRRMETQWTERLRDHLVQARVAGELRPDVDPSRLADLLLIVVVGIQMEFAAGSEIADPPRMRGIIEMAIRPWLSAGVVLPDVGRRADRR